MICNFQVSFSCKCQFKMANTGLNIKVSIGLGFGMAFNIGRYSSGFWYRYKLHLIPIFVRKLV